MRKGHLDEAEWVTPPEPLALPLFDDVDSAHPWRIRGGEVVGQAFRRGPANARRLRDELIDRAEALTDVPEMAIRVEASVEIAPCEERRFRQHELDALGDDVRTEAGCDHRGLGDERLQPVSTGAHRRDRSSQP